jgi:hypothetical protein
VTAPAIEEVVLEALKRHLPASECAALHQASGLDRWKLLRRSLRRVTLARDQITIELMKEPSPVEIPIRLKIRGGETLIVPPNASQDHPRPDATLIKALGRAWNWRRALERGSVRSVVEFAQASGCTVRYVTRLLKIAYLAPDIIEAILAGRQPHELTLAQLFRTDIPLDWQRQREALGF